MPDLASLGDFERFEDAASLLPGGFLVYEDTPEGKILHTNDELYAIFGCNDAREFEELTHNSFTEMVYEDDRQQVLSDIQRQIQSDDKSFDKVTYRIVTKQGAIRWVRDYGRLLDHPQLGPLYFVFIADVTEEKNSRNRLDLMLEMERLREIFVVVRLVNVNNNKVYEFDEAGHLVESESCCFSVWGKCSRCENCISAKAYGNKEQECKIEFMDGDAFYVVTRYVELHGNGYMMEMVTRLEDSALFNVYEKSEFTKLLQDYNRKVYVDALTGAYNRLYLDEQLSNLDNLSAICLVDLDNFKDINDTYGHAAGDAVLSGVVAALKDSVRSSDAVVRYGGDEFLILFSNFKRPALAEKMELIRQNIEDLRWSDYPEVRVTASIGALYSNDFNADVFDRVDNLMYSAKRKKNAVSVEN